ncbi:acetate--CoA ligase family protein [Flexivirga alba]|uniref:Acetate--CoA ligase family protein n=1 Tax=Flexivirga alba TaxID=702742 RepID=A0ABW2AJW8_9MICO
MSHDAAPRSAAMLRAAIQSVRSSGGQVVPEPEAKAVLRDFGIAVPYGHAGNDVLATAAGLDEPLVLKAVSPTLVHKSDAGGVRVGLRAAELPATAQQMSEELAEHGHRIERFLVEEMAAAGQEVAVGAVRTPGLGWTVMVGLGGVFIEVLADVAFGVAPLTSQQVRAMLRELQGMPLLEGARGAEPLDVDALVALVVRLAGADGLLAAMPDEVTEIDLNPVIVSTSGAVAVDARFVVGGADTAGERPARTAPATTDFSALFDPQTVAVLGASATKSNVANMFIKNLVAGGYAGRILPIHPSADTVEGLPATSSLGHVDGVVDYAFVALPAASVTPALSVEGANVRFAQVISSGFAEIEDGVQLEADLVTTMRSRGIRLLGPNCLGTHSSRARLGFIPDAPFEPGRVAVISQSGGLSVDILRLGSARGVAFHSVTSIGNGADVTAAELVQHFLDDPEIQVVGLYLESLDNARAVLDVLQERADTKPVVLLAGGRTDEGSRAATTHTGALTGNHRLWPALARQAGMVLADSLEDFLNVLLAFDSFDLSDGPWNHDVVLFGNGGGASVLAADALARRGLATPRLPEETIAALDSLGLPPGCGLVNPIDTPAGTLAVRGGAVTEDILTAVLSSSDPAYVITHLNVGIIQRNLAHRFGDVTGTIIDSIARTRDKFDSGTRHLLVLKGDGKPDIDEEIRGYARRASEWGIPAFPEFEDAAIAARALLDHHDFTARKATS